MKRTHGIAIATPMVLGLVIAMSGNKPPLHGDFHGLKGKITKGMLLNQALVLIEKENLDYSVKWTKGEAEVKVGGETWMNFFQKERQLLLSFDSARHLQGASIDVLYQFDEVAAEDFDIE